MRTGSARVPTRDQNLQLQSGAFAKAGGESIFQQNASGATKARFKLGRMLARLRPGGTFASAKPTGWAAPFSSR